VSLCISNLLRPLSSLFVFLASSFFFCSCSGPRRYLHSFPTRRSSDLHAACHDVFSLNKESVARGDPELAGQRDEWSMVTGRPREDRKSTRLNSSHVEISYAVFCLKKKKKDNEERTRTEKA